MRQGGIVLTRSPYHRDPLMCTYIGLCFNAGAGQRGRQVAAQSLPLVGL